MTSEHLLDAMGLLDDDLIQEAEGYTAPTRRANYGTWLAWAASFAVVLVLGYGLTHLNLGMGGGGANGGGNCQGASTASPSGSMNGGAAGGVDSSAPDGEGSSATGEDPPAAQEPADSGTPEETEGYLAVLIDGIVYRSTGEYVSLFPSGDDIRYDLVWYDEASGEARADPYLCYLALEDGAVAVSWAFQSQGWLIFAPVETP